MNTSNLDIPCIANVNSKKYALLFGSNNINDIKDFLIKKCDYKLDDILIANNNIIDNFNVLINKAIEEDYKELWFSYSGNNNYINNINICDLLVKLPEDCTLFMMYDCNQQIYINSDKYKATIISISGYNNDNNISWAFMNALKNANYDINVIDLVINMTILLQNKNKPLLGVSSYKHHNKKFMKLTNIINDITKSIKFTLATDYWYDKGSFNIWSFNDNK